MKTRELPLLELHEKGLQALCKELGPSGMIRFLQLYGTGMGDYTKERRKWLDKLSPEEMDAGIQAIQQKTHRRKAKAAKK